MEILKIHNNPERAEWAALTERFTREEEEITRQVTEILADVKSGGDRSLREVTRRVEGRDPRTFEIPADVRAAAAALIPAALKEALAAAKANIETFHRAQLPPEVDIETMPGVRCVQRAVPIRRVGLYIPGGKAPLFSTVLMLAVPARVAGCGEVILCTPARPDGTIAPEILYAADLCRMLDLRAGLAAYPSEEDTLRQSLCPTPGDYRDFRVFRGYLDQSMWKLDPVIGTMACPVCGTALQPDDVWLKKGSSGWYTLSQCPVCKGRGGEAGRGVFQKYRMSRRDGLHWAFARCVQMPDDASLVRWKKQKAQYLERQRLKAERQAAEAEAARHIF